MKDPQFVKSLVFINALIPGSLLAWDAWHHNLGANPVLEALHSTGTVALIFLLLSLTITPLRKITGRNWLSHFRRMLGLFAFFYGLVHLLIYFSYDKALSLRSV